MCVVLYKKPAREGHYESLILAGLTVIRIIFFENGLLCQISFRNHLIYEIFIIVAIDHAKIR